MIEQNMSTQDKGALIDAIGRIVMRWQDATQKYDETVGEIYGLNASERLCLSFLWLGRQTASAIAREIRLTPAAVTSLIDRLEKRGFVRRIPDPTDRRKVWIEAAEEAHRVTREAYLPLGEAGAKNLAKYSLAELEAVRAILTDAVAIQEAMETELIARQNKP
jgi:DNA-binding MarR family transcriptional regulator